MDNMQDKIADASVAFMGHLLGKEYSVRTAIVVLIDAGMVYGWDLENRKATSHIVASSFDDRQEIEAFATKTFFEVLCGRKTVGEFCEDIFVAAAAYNRIRKENMPR